MIRPAAPADWPGIWAVMEPVIRAGDTYTYDPDMTEAAARSVWTDPALALFVLAEGDIVRAVAKMGPNQRGPGLHIANASYMVDATARGRGIGRRLVDHTIRWATEAGYDGVQFNAVAETNAGAVALYRDMGFVILGTVPGGFAHPVQGKVGLHIMFRALT